MPIVIKEVLCTQEQIVKECERVGAQISKDYAGKCPIIVGILKGSVPFLAELIKHITIDCQLDFMCVSSYDGGTSSTGQVKIIKDLDNSIEGRDVIIIEDIVDTGLTLHTIVDMYKTRKPNSVEICCLLDKETGRKIEVNCKYVCFNIENNFVVGFGLDYDEKYRNLPYVGIVDTSKL